MFRFLASAILITSFVAAPLSAAASNQRYRRPIRAQDILNPDNYDTRRHNTQPIRITRHNVGAQRGVSRVGRRFTNRRGVRNMTYANRDKEISAREMRAKRSGVAQKSRARVRTVGGSNARRSTLTRDQVRRPRTRR